MGDRGEPPPELPSDLERCPYVDIGVMARAFDPRGGSQNSRLLHFVKLLADPHCVPDLGQSQPAASEHCLRRTSWRTWGTPRVGALVQATPPAQSPSPEAVGSPRPPTARDIHTYGPRLQHFNMIRNPRSPGPQGYRAPRRRSSAERELRDISLDPSRAPTYWLRADPGPHACYLYGRKRFLECAETRRGSRPHEKNLEASDSASPVSPSSLSAGDGINPETLLIMNPIYCASIIIAPLCLCLTRRPGQNKAVAPYNLIADSDKIRAISICCCPQCGCGPDVPDGDLSFGVSRCPQWESPPLAWEGNHPRLGSLLIVGICAAPSSERFTSAPLAPRLNQPTAVLRAIISIVPPGRSPACSNKILFRMSSWTLAVRYPRDRMNELAVIVGQKDPSCVPEVERENPTQRVRRLRATSSEGGPPLRRSGPFCTAASGDKVILWAVPCQ